MLSKELGEDGRSSSLSCEQESCRHTGLVLRAHLDDRVLTAPADSKCRQVATNANKISLYAAAAAAAARRGRDLCDEVVVGAALAEVEVFGGVLCGPQVHAPSSVLEALPTREGRSPGIARSIWHTWRYGHDGHRRRIRNDRRDGTRAVNASSAGHAGLARGARGARRAGCCRRIPLLAKTSQEEQDGRAAYYTSKQVCGHGEEALKLCFASVKPFFGG